MSLTLITGAANSGKSGVLYDRLRAAAADGAAPVLLLPSAADVRRAADEFARTRAVGFRVSTFPQWFESLWIRFGDGRRFVTPAVRTAFVDRVVTEQGLDAIQDSPGVRRLIDRLCARAGADPVPPDPSDEVATSLARVVSQYRSELRKSGLVERPDASATLCDGRVRLAGPLGINRFTDLEEWQAELLLALSRDNEVLLSVTWMEDSPSTEAAQSLVDRLRAAGAAALVASMSDSGPIVDFAEELFTSASPRPASASVQFGEASSPEAEASLVAAIARREIDGGTPPDRIAVAFRDPGARRWLIESAFRAEGVDVDIQYTAQLGDEPLAVALRTLVAASLGDGAATSIAGFIGSPFAGPVRRDALGIDERLRRSRDAGASGALELVARSGRWGARAVALARACARGLDQAQGLEAWQELTSMLADAASRESRATLSSPEAVRNARAAEAIAGVLDEIAAVGRSAAARDVLDAIDAARLQEGRGDIDGAVQCVGIEALRSRRFNVVVIGGLTGREFSSERREPLVASMCRRVGLPAGTEPALVERQLFYLAVSRARHTLVLVRQTANERGEAIRSSSFWDEALTRFGVEPDADLAETDVVLHRLGVRDLALTAPSSEPGRRELRAAAASTGVDRALRRGRLHEHVSSAFSLRERPFSATELETWLACPYRWFYERFVRPSRMDREVDALEIGTLSHELLAEFYRRWIATGESRVTASTLDTALATFEQVAADVLANRDVPSVGLADELSRARAVTRARRTVVGDIDYLPGFSPARFETPFGYETPFLFGGVPMHGRIDRIDTSPSGVVVTDYKSTQPGPNWPSWSDKGVLQMPVYASAAGEIVGQQVIGGVYRSLSHPAVAGFWADESERPDGMARTGLMKGGMTVGELIAQAEQLAQGAASGIRSGDIEKRPRDKGACKYCALNGVCETS